MKKQRFFLPLIARFLCPKQKKWYVSYFVSPPLKTDFCPSIISFLSFLSVLPIVLPFSTIIYSDSPLLPSPSARYIDLYHRRNDTNRKSTIRTNVSK